MYKVIKQNNSMFKKGELVYDNEYLQERKELQAEGATPAVVQFIPNFRVSVSNRNTGEVYESTRKFADSKSALTHGVFIVKEHIMTEHATAVVPGIYAVILVTEDGREHLRVEIKSGGLIHY